VYFIRDHHYFGVLEIKGSLQLNEQVLVEQDLSEMLLLNVMPQAIAERLKARSKLTADHLSHAIVDS
jgi:hypothetical protein